MKRAFSTKEIRDTSSSQHLLHSCHHFEAGDSSSDNASSPPFHPQPSAWHLHAFASAIKSLCHHSAALPSSVCRASRKASNKVLRRMLHHRAVASPATMTTSKSLYLSTDVAPGIIDLDAYNEHADLYRCVFSECGIVLTPCVIHDPPLTNSDSSQECEKASPLQIPHTVLFLESNEPRGSTRKENPENWGIISFGASLRRFTIHELVAATSKFSEKNILAKGSHGTVFLGALPNGRKVAVKSLTFRTPEAEKELRTQLHIMSMVKHRYILPLLGYATDEAHLFLVYRFLAKGNVDFHLHAEKSKHGLSLSQRYKIATGIAKALNYLHFDCTKSIIHRDIKASNILLTKDYKPKLSDFSLAMWAPKSFILCSEVMGTFGFVAPEYFQYGKVSKKIDVFAFGVVLLELITGRRAIEPSMPAAQGNLVLWARPLLYSGLTEELVDPRLKGSYCARRMQNMLCTAALCVHPADTQRPSISQALHLLERQERSFCLFRNHSPRSVFLTMDKTVLSMEDENRTALEDDREKHLAIAMTSAWCAGATKEEQEESETRLLEDGMDLSIK